MSSLKTAVDPAAWGAPGAGPASNPAPPGPGPFPQKVTPSNRRQGASQIPQESAGVSRLAFGVHQHADPRIPSYSWYQPLDINKEAKRKDGHIQAYRNGKLGG